MFSVTTKFHEIYFVKI